MKVSVIIPVYNTEKYLRACLDSVLNQSLEDIEVVCVDDCSSDNSADIIAEYVEKDRRMKSVRNERNGGLSYTRNQGLKVTAGEYVCFLDSDDMLTSTALEELYKTAEENRTDIIFFDSEMLIESENVSKEEAAFCAEGDYEGVMSGKVFLKEMQKINNVRIPACLQFWNRRRFDEMQMGFLDGIFHEDILFTYFALMKAQRVLCVRKAYYIYRRHDNSITLRKINENYVKSLLIIYHEIVNYWYDYKDEDIDHITRVYLKSVQWKLNKYITDLEKTKDELKEILGKESIYGYWFDKLEEEPVKLTNESWVPTKKLIQMAKAKKAYIYGAGQVARKYLPLLQEYEIQIDGILVSDVANNPPHLLGIPVCGLDEVSNYKDDCAILIGVGRKLREEVIEILSGKGFSNIVEFY